MEKISSSINRSLSELGAAGCDEKHPHLGSDETLSVSPVSSTTEEKWAILHHRRELLKPLLNRHIKPPSSLAKSVRLMWNTALSRSTSDIKVNKGSNDGTSSEAEAVEGINKQGYEKNIAHCVSILRNLDPEDLDEAFHSILWMIKKNVLCVALSELENMVKNGELALSTFHVFINATLLGIPLSQLAFIPIIYLERLFSHRGNQKFERSFIKEIKLVVAKTGTLADKIYH